MSGGDKMYTELAYLGKKHEDIVDNTTPFLVTAVGHYIVNKSYRVPTNRRLGRGDYQLLYIADGSGVFKLNGEKRMIGKGHMFLFRPGQEQIYDLFKKDNPETYWVHFTGYDVERILDEYNMPKQTVTYIGSSADYSWYFRQMIFELRERRQNYAEMLEHIMFQLFIVIGRNSNVNTSLKFQVANEIEKSIHYFESNYDTDINIEEYTKQHFIKPCWFIRNFKNTTGKTPMQYIISLRIDKSKELLLTTESNVSQISGMVGYDNPLYFSRIFKKHTGMSPLEYRKLYKQ